YLSDFSRITRKTFRYVATPLRVTRRPCRASKLALVERDVRVRVVVRAMAHVFASAMQEHAHVAVGNSEELRHALARLLVEQAELYDLALQLGHPQDAAVNASQFFGVTDQFFTGFRVLLGEFGFEQGGCPGAAAALASVVLDVVAHQHGQELERIIALM